MHCYTVINNGRRVEGHGYCICIEYIYVQSLYYTGIKDAIYLLLVVGDDASDKVRLGLPQGIHQVGQLLLRRVRVNKDHRKHQHRTSDTLNTDI